MAVIAAEDAEISFHPMDSDKKKTVLTIPQIFQLHIPNDSIQLSARS
jgi:hypothetical protein